VIAATGADGSDVQRVRVLINGALLVDQLTGAAIDVDPGQHDLRFELAGSQTIERTITLREGEQRRRIEVAFAAKRVAPATSEPGEDPKPVGVGPWPYALGAVGIVGLGGFAYFGYRGLQTKSELDEQNCKPACSQDRVDEGNRQFLIADISLGIGVAALGAATYLWLSNRESEPAALHVEASPQRAFVAWHARF
jgi:hypothetical protein